MSTHPIKPDTPENRAGLYIEACMKAAKDDKILKTAPEAVRKFFRDFLEQYLATLQPSISMVPLEERLFDIIKTCSVDAAVIADKARNEHCVIDKDLAQSTASRLIEIARGTFKQEYPELCNATQRSWLRPFRGAQKG